VVTTKDRVLEVDQEDALEAHRRDALDHDQGDLEVDPDPSRDERIHEANLEVDHEAMIRNADHALDHEKA